MAQQPGGNATRDAIDNLALAARKLAVDTPWPSTDQGRACGPLAIDIAEHCWLFAAGYLNGRLSATLSLARPLTERLQTIMAAAMDAAFARRYLDTGVAVGEPRKRQRARADDARGILGRKRHPNDREAQKLFHEELASLLGTQSEYLHGSLLSPHITLLSAVLPDHPVASNMAIVVGTQLTWAVQQLAIAATILDSQPSLTHAIGSVEQWRDALEAIGETGIQEVRAAAAAFRPWLDELCADLSKPDLGLSRQE